MNSQNNELLFSLQNLHFTYPNGIHALKNINLDIAPNDRLAIIGSNGSGKTTLARQLSGLDQPTKGSLYYCGTPLTGSYYDSARLEIGILFQDPDDQLFCHNILEDVIFGAYNKWNSRPTLTSKTNIPTTKMAKEALAQVNLAHLIYKQPHHLSFGEKKRAALATLLVMQPQVLILDEPSAGLDHTQRELFIQILRDFKGSILCISHDLDFVEQICSHALILKNGSISQSININELKLYDIPYQLKSTKKTNSQVLDNSPLCALSNYSFVYKDGTRALDNISLEIKKGERVALQGDNGAGKSTLLHCLLGIYQGVGDYYFNGKKITFRKHKERKMLWQQIGMVFQRSADQFFCSSVANEIAFGMQQAGVSPEIQRHRVNEMLKLVQIEHLRERVPLQLSGGERKRLALACALIMQPKLLILDEPSVGLDAHNEALLIDILSNITCSMILVSHNKPLFEQFTTRKIILKNSQLISSY